VSIFFTPRFAPVEFSDRFYMGNSHSTISVAMGDHGFALFILFLGAWRPRCSLGANVELHFQPFFVQKHIYMYLYM
jgi:hypothetical protein